MKRILTLATTLAILATASAQQSWNANEVTRVLANELDATLTTCFVDWDAEFDAACFTNWGYVSTNQSFLDLVVSSYGNLTWAQPWEFMDDGESVSRGFLLEGTEGFHHFVLLIVQEDPDNEFNSLVNVLYHGYWDEQKEEFIK